MKIACAVVIGAAALCGGAGCTEGEIRHVVIEPAEASCDAGSGPSTCLRVSYDGGPVRLNYFGIVDFEHRWGFRSELTVTVEPIRELEDGPANELVLRELISDERDPNGTRYDYFSFGGSSPFEAGSSVFVRLLSGERVGCEPALCVELLERTSPYVVTLELQAPDAPEPLRAIAIADP